jgi:hypothetical protein
MELAWSSPIDGGVEIPATILRLTPATRIMKNSSIVRVNMHEF